MMKEMVFFEQSLRTLIGVVALMTGCCSLHGEESPKSHAISPSQHTENTSRLAEGGAALEGEIAPELVARFLIPRKVLRDYEVRSQILRPLKTLKTSTDKAAIQQALARLQSILDREEDFLLPPSQVTLQLVAELALASLDRNAEAYRLYVTEHGATAQGELKVAKKGQPNLAKLERLSQRFANTPSGLEILQVLASHALDKGKAEEACFYFNRMQAQGPLSPEQSIAALKAYQMRGSLDSYDKAEHLGITLRQSGIQTVTLGGKTQPLEVVAGPILAEMAEKKRKFVEEEKKHSNLEVFLKLAETEEDKKMILEVINSESFRYRSFTFPSEGLEVTLGEKMNPVKVRFKKPFAIQFTPVTQLQWGLVMGENPFHFQTGEEEVSLNGIAMLPNHPVGNVSYEMVQEFIKKLNALDPTHHYDLPTEAQYEYAMRGGTQTEYFFGDDGSKLGDYAWYSVNSEGRTHPVGEKKQNPFGLYDMAGNVWQWNRDWYSENLTAGEDPMGPFSGSYRVLRGGSWYYGAGYARSALRNFNDPGNCNDNVGFRLARTPK